MRRLLVLIVLLTSACAIGDPGQTQPVSTNPVEATVPPLPTEPPTPQVPLTLPAVPAVPCPPFRQFNTPDCVRIRAHWKIGYRFRRVW